MFTALPPRAFACYRVIVFDGRSFEHLASAEGHVTGHQRPVAEVPFAWAGESYNTVGEAQRAQLRDIVFDLLARSIPPTLIRTSLLRGHRGS